MTPSALLLGLGAVVACQLPDVEPGHAGNPVYQALREHGSSVGETRVEFPAPALHDGASADDERAALKAITGSERAIGEFTRDSVTAPVVVKTHDLKAPDGTIRRADIWFVVHADLDAIEPARTAEAAEGEGEVVEAGNMRFHARTLSLSELVQRGVRSPKLAKGYHEWYSHTEGRLLDRIRAEVTARTTATRTDGSWVIASQTDRSFDRDSTFPNCWTPIARKGEREEPAEPRRYAGAAGFAKISRLNSVPGALLVEAHLAFDEPRAWFDGAPILRSKIGVVVQDRVRALRRELARGKSRGGQPVRKASGSSRG
jgi:hypothetical protein